ncbi:Cu2+-exporting ATPase [Enhydrobacter aerosaccus]|uniref:P-type Zn(2+) transporter n=1 Tax=Enhydrobacter aerosaccus TaxID=225324 RepID=A0A1T4LGK3_9HYPH|nr:heavy metal translocating P-type ATPase [Enhydrobacter aerosaccus]SJZ53813.1 Cu2+-exporting ATPase [Enhydrobacter aerosaccus]
MDLAIRHYIPGRVRLHVPELCRRPSLADSTVDWLNRQEGIKGARVNYDCACLVVEYERDRETFFRHILTQLTVASVTDIASVVGVGDAPEKARSPASAVASPAKQSDTKNSNVPPTRSEVPGLFSSQSPLALPTLSLAMAFSSNPFVVALNIPLMLWNGLPIARRALHVWQRESRLNVDTLDTLAIIASVAQGNAVAGSIITWLIKLGDWIRDLTAAGSRRAIADLLEFQSKKAWVKRDGRIVAVPAVELAVDDLVVVYPGEIIPVDGEIVEGTATIDQKTITGEGLPVSRRTSDTAYAATVIREGQITIRAVRVGTDTTAGQIAHLVESAPLGDTRMQNHAELLADRLVMPTLALATGTAVVTADFSRFLSLVIVDYGTGIRVAAPTSALSSMTHAARAGIIIKSGAHMERLSKIDTIVFDKTGTLTHGVPAVTDVVPFIDHITPNHLLGLAAAAETRLHHPVAEALRSRARELAVNIPECDETEYRVGLGVEGQVNGYYMHVGSERFMRHSGIDVGPALAARATLDHNGQSALYVAVDGKLGGLVSYADKIRPESREVVARLHDMGIRNTVMLTGDNAVVARAVGGRLGLTRVIADMMPADKAGVIQELQRNGHVVAMVGDGINDSPALSFADIGIAMKHGAEIAHESAHVVLMEDSLWKLVKAVEISRNAVSLIRQNYAIVAALNTLALGLALPGGLISPTTTALLSNGSAIAATLNGMRPILRYQ